MIRLCVLASSSTGNSTLVESKGARVLIDAGLPGSRITRLLAAVGVEADSLEAILVSHEHRDHITGVGVLARRLRVPVYINAPTFDRAKAIIGKIPHYSLFENGRPFILGDLEVEPFSQPHDAVDPVGFVLRSGTAVAGLAMDLGKVTGLVRTKLQGCQGLVLEANHDNGLLMNGPYPWPLKQRIRSDQGHLSNESAAQALLKLVPAGAKNVLLGHLSQENNQPDLALSTVKRVLAGAGLSWADIHLTYSDRPSRVVEINGLAATGSR